MKRKVLLLLTIIAAVSFSACADKTTPPVDSTEAEVVASTLSTEESRRTEDASDRTEHQTSSSEQVNEPSETQSVVSKPAEPSETETRSEKSEQTAVVSQPTVPERTETPTPATAEPEPTPIASAVTSQPEPTPTAQSVTPEPQPTEPAFDVSQYVSYGKNYGQGIGLMLDSSAVSCWDDPISANADCIYLERDIRDRLDWYLASGYTAFWVWSQDVGGGTCLIYIGYA